MSTRSSLHSVCPLSLSSDPFVREIRQFCSALGSSISPFPSVFCSTKPLDLQNTNGWRWELKWSGALALTGHRSHSLSCWSQAFNWHLSYRATPHLPLFYTVSDFINVISCLYLRGDFLLPSQERAIPPNISQHNWEDFLNWMILIACQLSIFPLCLLWLKCLE